MNRVLLLSCCLRAPQAIPSFFYPTARERLEGLKAARGRIEAPCKAEHASVFIATNTSKGWRSWIFQTSVIRVHSAMDKPSSSSYLRHRIRYKSRCKDHCKIRYKILRLIVIEDRSNYHTGRHISQHLHKAYVRLILRHPFSRMSWLQPQYPMRLEDRY